MKELLAADRERIAWRRVTRTRLQTILALGGMTALMILFGGLLQHSSVARKVLGALAVLAMITTVSLLARVRCPRCGGRFYLRGSRPPTGGCGQCGAKPPAVTSSPS